MAHIDSDGFIFITGRLERFVKIHGVSVNLEHVENVIREEGFDCHLSVSDNIISVVTQQNYGDEILNFEEKIYVSFVCMAVRGGGSNSAPRQTRLIMPALKRCWAGIHMLLDDLVKLTERHRLACPFYRDYTDSMFADATMATSLVIFLTFRFVPSSSLI